MPDPLTVTPRFAPLLDVLDYPGYEEARDPFCDAGCGCFDAIAIRGMLLAKRTEMVGRGTRGNWLMPASGQLLGLTTRICEIEISGPARPEPVRKSPAADPVSEQVKRYGVDLGDLAGRVCMSVAGVATDVRYSINVGMEVVSRSVESLDGVKVSLDLQRRVLDRYVELAGSLSDTVKRLHDEGEDVGEAIVQAEKTFATITAQYEYEEEDDDNESNESSQDAGSTARGGGDDADEVDDADDGEEDGGDDGNDGPAGGVAAQGGVQTRAEVRKQVPLAVIPHREPASVPAPMSGPGGPNRAVPNSVPKPVVKVSGKSVVVVDNLVVVGAPKVVVAPRPKSIVPPVIKSPAVVDDQADGGGVAPPQMSGSIASEIRKLLRPNVGGGAVPRSQQIVTPDVHRTERGAPIARSRTSSPDGAPAKKKQRQEGVRIPPGASRAEVERIIEIQRQRLLFSSPEGEEGMDVIGEAWVPEDASVATSVEELERGSDAESQLTEEYEVLEFPVGPVAPRRQVAKKSTKSTRGRDRVRGTSEEKRKTPRARRADTPVRGQRSSSVRYSGRSMPPGERGNDGLYKCPVCSRKFKKAVPFVMHMGVHRGKSPDRSDRLYCRHCDRVFENRANFREHRLMLENREVAEEYPCEFTGCGKVFSTPKLLTKHEQVHKEHTRKELTCKFCKKMYMIRSSMLRHQRSCGQVWECFEGCLKDGEPETFARNDNRVRHYQLRHPGVAPPIEEVRDRRDRDRVEAARVSAARGKGVVLTRVGIGVGMLEIRRSANAPAAAGGPTRRPKPVPAPKKKADQPKPPKSKGDKEDKDGKDSKGKRHGRK